MQLQQQQMEQQAQMAQAQMEQQMAMNQEDNETKILVANIQATNRENESFQEPEFSEESRAKLIQQMKEFDEKIKLERDKFEFEKQKHRENNQLKDTISRRQSARYNNNK